MGEKVKHDEIRILRFSIKQDEQRLANAPLGPGQKLHLKKSIERQKERLKELLEEKREKKKQDDLQ